MKLRIAAAIGFLAIWPAAWAADPLPDLQADTSSISVSGLSSGAAMATQLGVAYSDRVTAVGMMAGPPYLCAQGSSDVAVVSCLTMNVDFWGIPGATVDMGRRDDVDASDLIAATRVFDVVEGSIAPLANLHRQRVWVSRGRRDAVVGPHATQAVRTFYTAFGAALAPEDGPDVPHTLPTDKPRMGPCDGRREDPDFVSSCGLDQVGRMFGYLFGWQPAERGQYRPDNLIRFDQARYLESGPGRQRTPQELSMAREGRAYVPDECRQGGCKVHVALHGCRQGSDKAYDVFTRKGGYNEWAESHRVIVLYPRVVVSNGLPFNPRGCWDWWGYAPNDRIDWRGYAKRGASQMRSIMNMVDALGGGREP